jgi:hypothetical protein
MLMNLLSIARVALVVGGCSFVTRPAMAQTGGSLAEQHGDPTTTPGVWIKMDRVGPNKPSVAEKHLIALLDSVATLFRPLAVLNPPIGFSVMPRNVLTGRDFYTKMQTGAYLNFLFSHSLKPDGTVDTHVGGHAEGLAVSADANTLECFLSSNNFAHFDDRDGQLYNPPAIGNFHGFVTYGASVDESGQLHTGCIFITKRTMPPFIPASRARVMKIAIEQFHEIPEVAKELQKQFDAMSAADGAAPAYLDMAAYVNYSFVRTGSAPLLGTAGQLDKNGSPLQAIVQRNSAFFDATRPGDIQSLTITVPGLPPCDSQDDPVPYCKRFHGAFTKIRDTLDWAALAAIVK